MGQSQGTAMQGGEQGSLWQQSDLLDLVGSTGPQQPALPQDPERPEARHDSTPVAGPAATAAPDVSQDPDGGATANARPDPAGSSVADHAVGPASATTAAPVNPAEMASAPLATGRGNQDAGPMGGPEEEAPESGDPSSPVRPEASAPGSDAAGRAGREGPRAASEAAMASVSLPVLDAPKPGPRPASPGAPLPGCPERLLILDTETTALSPQQGQCIEVGAVLFDVASRAVLMQVSFLLPCDHNPAQAVNGIPAAVTRLEQPWRSGLACFEAMVAGADALLAHNAAFDRQWFGSGVLPALDRPWICSMEDIRWPAERQLRPTPSVRDLALAYGVPVWAAHRALTDCIYLVQVFQRCEPLEELLQAALEPRRLVRARLSYDERQLAKDAGFRWNEPLPKAWSRRLSEREIALLPFAVDPVEADEQTADRGSRFSPQPWRRSA